MIVVAQRVSSILDADTIVVLNEGKVAGIGNHEDLLKNCPIYQDIVKSQLDPDEVEKLLKYLAKPRTKEVNNYARSR